jgi:hypothetical protein
MRVALLRGGVQNDFDPTINESTIRFLSRGGTETVVTQGKARCDAQTHHTREEQSAFVRADYSVLHIPTCQERHAFDMRGMADRQGEAASRLTFDKARADQDGQAKNAYDQSRRTKRYDVHKDYMELVEVHEDTKAEGWVLREDRLGEVAARP